MRRLMVAVLYTAVTLGANLACAAPAAADVAAASAVVSGAMRKLQFHDTPKPVPPGDLIDMVDAPRRLDEWTGKWVLVNFWATWCAPCRQEMPGLAALSAAGETAVVTVAVGRNPPEAITRFMTEIGVIDLPILRDPTSALSRKMSVLGLPLTVILNPEGDEVARLIGDAEWNGPDAKAVLDALRQ